MKESQLVEIDGCICTLESMPEGSIVRAVIITGADDKSVPSRPRGERGWNRRFA